MEFSKIILRPMHTEKSYALQNLEPKKQAFIVSVEATKTDIKLAFESIYGFAPSKVSTQIRKPAKIRTGTAKPGYTKLTKIAYVTLPAGKSIAIEEDKQPVSESKTETKTKTSIKEVKAESSIKEVKKEAAKAEPKQKSTKKVEKKEAAKK